jgi:hypothetical protein
MYLVLFMLLSTGFLFALTGGYRNIALSNQVDGVYSHQTIVGATWQASNSGTMPLSGERVTIYHYDYGVRYNDTSKLTNTTGQITYTTSFTSTGTRNYYATFAGDAAYDPLTSGVVNVNVGSSQGSNQATTPAVTNGGVAQTITLSASTTAPAVGQPVTFAATLTGRQVVYEDYYNQYILAVLGIGRQAQILDLQNGTANGSTVFLGTYNIENNQALVVNFIGVNAQQSYVNATPLISNRSLIYSNGGASIYS